MHIKHELYPAFKKDLATLAAQAPGNRWVEALGENIASGTWHRISYDEQRRLVDRLDETLPHLPLWRNIRVAYKFHGTTGNY